MIGQAGRAGPLDRAQRNFTDQDSRILPTRDGVVRERDELECALLSGLEHGEFVLRFQPRRR